ncbi:TadE/TadG family type IV pilus assembly protein [Planctomicrobium sp. SH664]|uniref:TadE/TadG family type IV pilus assembly protein n=1 Tax=Planctomicrobium sp. SH664 TaxID=3448125 RepID=UPI003F5BCD1A
MQVRQTYPRNKPDDRRGAATVEFAIVAPIFLSLILGISEMSRGLEVSQNLSAAVREGGRLGASDDKSVLSSGVTMNSKVITDIRNMMTATGIDGSKVAVTITHADGEQAGQPFNFADESNYLKNFRITAQINYSDASKIAGRIMKNKKLTSSIVLRLGRSRLST